MLAIIGKVVKQLREEQELTLEELSARSNVSVEKLTEIESNRSIPSLGVLIRISRALGSRLGTLLDGQENTGAVINRRREVNEFPSFSGPDAEDSAHLRFFSLAKDKSDRHMEPLVIAVKPNSADHPELRSEHEGEEFLFVLDGEIVFYYGNDKHTLSVGDSVYFDSIVPHYLGNERDTRALVLATIYTPY